MKLIARSKSKRGWSGSNNWSWNDSSERNGWKSSEPVNKQPRMSEIDRLSFRNWSVRSKSKSGAPNKKLLRKSMRPVLNSSDSRWSKGLSK